MFFVPASTFFGIFPPLRCSTSMATAIPITMTRKRAKDLLARMRYGSFPMAFVPSYQIGGTVDPNGITEDEDRQIKAVWETMPGNTAYVHAVQRIARGQV